MSHRHRHHDDGTEKTVPELLGDLIWQGAVQVYFLKVIAEQGATNMPVDNAQITEALDRIEGNTENIKTFVQTTNTEITALQTEVQALKDQIAAGNPITEEQAQAILDRVNTIDAAQDAALAPPAP